MGEAGVGGALIVQPINHKFDHSYVTRLVSPQMLSELRSKSFVSSFHYHCSIRSIGYRFYQEKLTWSVFFWAVC